MADSTWAVLTDPTRRAILDVLRDRECAVNDLVGVLRLTQPQASKHLRVLREAGLVRVRKDAQRRLYRLEAGPLTELDAWLAPYRSRWNAALDALGEHLEENP